MTIDQVNSALVPEELFGDEPSGLSDAFRDLAKVLHPDAGGSAEAFKKLSAFRDMAEQKIKDGTYGNRRQPVVLTTKVGYFNLGTLITHGDLCEVFNGTNDKGQPVCIKITRSPANNDLVSNEAAKIKYLPESPHVPKLLDSFILTDKKINKQVNVLQSLGEFYSLRQVREAYPNGLHLGDAAWMFNRLLSALAVAHKQEVVHGAVTLDHFMIRPSDHNGVLIDWSYSVVNGQPLKAICANSFAVYPPEIWNKSPTTFGTDLYMAALLFRSLVANPLPRKILGLMEACVLGSKHRTTDVFELFHDFNSALRDTFGKPKFRPFVMPEVLNKK